MNLDLVVRKKLGGSISERVLELDDFLKEKEDIIVSLSGGSRDILIPLTLTVSMNCESVSEVYFRSDLDNEINKIEMPFLPQNVKKSEKQLLSSIESEVSIKDLSEISGKSESTLYSSLERMEEKNLVYSKGSPRKYSKTLSGKLVSKG